MQKAIIGKKIGMTQVFTPEGTVIPVTVVEAGPCQVVQKKTVEKDGYAAIQLGYEDKKAKLVTKPMKGHFDKAGVAFKKVLKEFRLDDVEALNVADTVNCDIFADGDIVDVTGTSKGKGFAGAIKRWGLVPRSYGTRLRLPQRRRIHGRLLHPFARYEGQKAGWPHGC